jgi:uncharacterized membrane protein
MFPVYLIHPMIVHFPIVLLLLVPVVDFFALARGGDLAARSCVPNVALITLLLGILAGLVAITFGEIAADHAVSIGFSDAPIDRHEGFAITTISLFAVLAAVRLIARWKKISLAGSRGWALFAVTLVGAALIIVTAYFGGHLVYDLGVNVEVVKP